MAAAKPPKKQALPQVRPAGEAREGAADGPPSLGALARFPIDAIEIGERLRALDEANVQALMVAIGESGFTGAILLRTAPSKDGEPRAILVAGRHRLEAMRRLGATSIPASVRRMTDDEALQVEIDENLIRKGLTPLERSEMVLKRFTVWARRFPERVAVDDEAQAPKRGRPKNSDKLSQFRGSMGFAAETASDLGVNPRTVERAWALVNGVPADLRAQLHGTWIARNDAILRQLAGVADKAEQAAIVEQLLGGVTKFSDARALANGNTPVPKAQSTDEELLNALMALWKKATPSGLDMMCHWMSTAPRLPKRYRIVRVDNG